MRLLDCDRQTAMRDLRSLEEAGVPLRVCGEGIGRRHVLPDIYRRKGLVLTVGDTLALHFGRQLLGFLEGTTLSAWLDGLLEKLAPATSGPAARTEARLAGRLVYLSEPHYRSASYDDTLNELLTAIVRNQELALDHAVPEVRHYEPAQPLALVIYRRALYLLARVPGRERPLRLAIEQIVRARRLPTHFSVPRGYDARTDLGDGFGIADDGESPSRVLLRFDARVARQVTSKVWHPSQHFVSLPDGGVELHMRTHGPQLLPLVLEYGDAVEVLEPRWLREAVVDSLVGALERYGVTLAMHRATGS